MEFVKHQLTSFLIDVSRKAGFMRSVDWISFMLYVVPTLVFEQLETEYKKPAPQIKALMSLVTGCALALQWIIYPSDLAKIKS